MWPLRGYSCSHGWSFTQAQATLSGFSQLKNKAREVRGQWQWKIGEELQRKEWGAYLIKNAIFVYGTLKQLKISINLSGTRY